MKYPSPLKTLITSCIAVWTIVVGGGSYFLYQHFVTSRAEQANSDSESSKNSFRAEGEQIRRLVANGDYEKANEIFVENVPNMRTNFDRAWPLRAYFEEAFDKRAQAQNEPKRQLWQSLLVQKKYVELEKIYDDLLASKKQSPFGTWQATTLIESMCPKDTSANDSWEVQISRLKAWISDRPNSYLAKLVLADILVNYAWKARGSGYANTISDEGGKQFDTRLEQAEQILKNITVRTPNWYAVRQTVALGQGMEPVDYDKMVEEGRNKFPDFATIVTRKVYHLLPRWYGKDGETESCLNSECKKLDESDGDVLYAQAVISIEASIGNALNNCAFSWPRTQRGMRALIHQHPDWYYGRCLYSILAMEAGDKKAAETAFNLK